MAKRNRRGRPKMTEQQKLDAATERTQPNDRVMERRKLFSFVQLPADKRLDGRSGEIDSEVCDGIGQFCALGLLDGHGHDPVELRDKGRFWGGHYARLMKGSSARTGNYERKDRSEPTGALTGADLLFDRMDESLGDGLERDALMSLIIRPLIGCWPDRDKALWVEKLINDALREKGRTAAGPAPNRADWIMLAAAIRGLSCLVDGSLAPRWSNAA